MTRDDTPRPSRIPRSGQRAGSQDDSGTDDGAGRGPGGTTEGAGHGYRYDPHGGAGPGQDRHARYERDRRPGADPLWGLPDPEVSPAFYENIPSKRLIAFLADSLVIGVLTVVLIPFTAFTAVFYLPFLAMLVSFAYRTLTLATGSATLGMRLVGIEMRNHRGERLDLMTAAGHTLLFTLFLGMVVPLLVSALLMLTTARRQGLHDMILGTAALNRPAGR